MHALGQLNRWSLLVEQMVITKYSVGGVQGRCRVPVLVLIQVRLMQLRICLFLRLLCPIILPASGMLLILGMLTMSNEQVLVILPVGRAKFHKGIAKYSVRSSKA